MPETAVERCPFQDALEILGKRHTLNLLWVFQQKSPRRFLEIRGAMNINPVTLSERLSELERCRILERTVVPQSPPRVDYALTPKGRDLLVLLDDLEKWSQKHPALSRRAAPT